ncbi:MAG: DUF4270 family protein [Flavobacteriales bacterium]|nr:DUF4270 family protein [Flavobacteriales bacterium]
MKVTSNLLLRKAFFLSVAFFLTFLFSCKKNGELSPDFDNGNLSVNFTDTFSIKTSLVQEDSLRTDLSTSHILGIYRDPIFGLVSSSIYSQVILTGVNVDFNAPVSSFDSIVLTLDYLGLYGDTLWPMTVNVFELSDALDKGTDNYSNTYVAHNSTPLGSTTFTPNLSDSITTIPSDTIVQKAHLRIRLDDTFGQNIMAADASGTNDLSNNNSFTSFMKGLYITTNDSVSTSSLNTNEGSLIYFDMNSPLTTLTVYYQDSLSYNFTINAEGEIFSRFDFNYTGTDIEKHLTNDISRDQTVTYVATMGRVKTKIELPTIKDLNKNGAVTINKAELTFTVKSGSDLSPDDLLESLTLIGINATGEGVFLPDALEGLDHYGGTYDETTNSFTYNITRHIHQLVYNTPIDYGMYLIANGATTIANRAVINSENSPTFEIKLEITYSKI